MVIKSDFIKRLREIELPRLSVEGFSGDYYGCVDVDLGSDEVCNLTFKLDLSVSQIRREGGEPSEYWTEWVLNSFEILNIELWLEGYELTLTNEEYEILSKKINEAVA